MPDKAHFIGDPTNPSSLPLAFQQRSVAHQQKQRIAITPKNFLKQFNEKRVVLLWYKPTRMSDYKRTIIDFEFLPLAFSSLCIEIKIG